MLRSLRKGSLRYPVVQPVAQVNDINSIDGLKTAIIELINNLESLQIWCAMDADLDSRSKSSSRMGETTLGVVVILVGLLITFLPQLSNNTGTVERYTQILGAVNTTVGAILTFITTRFPAASFRKRAVELRQLADDVKLLKQKSHIKFRELNSKTPSATFAEYEMLWEAVSVAAKPLTDKSYELGVRI